MNNIREIERYIAGTMAESEEVSFRGRVQKDPVLKMNLFLQEKVMVLVRIYHRKKIKAELKEVHERLVNDPLKVRFRENVIKMFGDN